MRYIQIIRYLEQGSSDSNVWEGKMKNIDKNFNKIKATMCTKDELKKMKEEIT
jgi:hypothetical protein